MSEDEGFDKHEAAASAHEGQLAHSFFPLHDLYKTKNVPALCSLRAHRLWLNGEEIYTGLG